MRVLEIHAINYSTSGLIAGKSRLLNNIVTYE